MREARVSCPRPLCPCVSQEALRVLTPLRRCQNLVCGEAYLAFLLLPHGLRWKRKVAEGKGQKFLGSQMRTPGSTQLPFMEGSLAKARAGPLLWFYCLGSLRYPLPI